MFVYMIGTDQVGNHVVFGLGCGRRRSVAAPRFVLDQGLKQRPHVFPAAARIFVLDGKRIHHQSR